MEVKEKIVKAFSLAEACDIVQEQIYGDIAGRRIILHFPFVRQLDFDDNKRVVLPEEGEMVSIARLE